MDVNPPASSEEGKSDGFSSKTKRTYVIGVVDTTGMKSVNSNRKRRWDQPPDKDDDDAPPKVIVREVESDTTAPELLTMVCEGDTDMEDYDAQYNECVNSNDLVSDGASVEPILEGVSSTPVSDVDGSAPACTDKEVIDPQLGIPKNPSPVNSEPENLPPPPVVEERPITQPIEMRGRTDPLSSSSTDARDREKPNSERASRMVGKVEDKKVAKSVEAIPVAGVISDSLKQIQFCYDEDSNSTEDSEVDTKLEGVEPNETTMAAEEVDETKIAKEAVDETKIAEEAVDIIVNKTKLDKEAIDTVFVESKIAKEAVDETKISKSAINPSEGKDLEQSKLPRRSPTPVLNDEVVSLSEDGMTQNERCAIVDSKTEADEVILQSETAVSTEVQHAVVNSSNANSITPGENSSMSITDAKISELKVKPVDSIDSAAIKSASPFCEPPEEKILLDVQCDEVEPPKNELVDNKISHADEKTPLLPILNEVSSKTLEDSDSPERAKVGEVERDFMQSEVLAAQSKATEPNNEVTVQDEPLKTPGNLTIDESSCEKQFTNSIDCNSEPSFSKEMKMFMEESSEKYMNITDNKLLTKDSDGTAARTNLISMDNSQNCCVGFDDLSSLEKAPSKSPELELRYSDSEDSNKPSSEVTMHFASFRTPESATDAVPESDFEDTKDETEKATDAVPESDFEDTKDATEKAIDAVPESDFEDTKDATEKAIDAVPESDFEDAKDESEKATDAQRSANPDLTGGTVELRENTMEMLDSLVRRSSEDDPSRIQLGEGMLSEDSLINEINQLPDNDDKKVGVPEDSSEPVVRGDSSFDPKNKIESTVIDAVEIVGEKDTDASKSVSTAVTSGLSNPDDKLDSPGKVANEAGIERIPAKSECNSAEDDLSQGGEEEHKNDNVSSENILEVIFGSKQESRIRTIQSMKSETDSEVTQEKKHVEGSSAIHVQPNDSSYSNDAQQSADDSKLQLNNEEIEIDNTEIVMVDPTKPLSGEDTDNDVDDGSSERESSANDKAIVSTTVTPVDAKTVTQSTSSCVSAVASVPDEEVQVVKETLMEVDESESSDIRGSKTAEAEPVVSEPMDVDKPVEHVVEATTASVLRMDESVVIKTRKETKASPIAEVSASREHAVPVLIIKKQAMPSKKEGDKNVVETLLTCSPKAADNLVSGSSTPPRKTHNEGHHIETVQDSSVGSSSPKHSPITLRIYKDNLTVKTDLDSPKRNKSPMSSEFKSELSPKLRSPSVSENLSPQNKQLEFTLKIAKDVHTNYPKATMSPKNVSSPSSVWKSEVQIADSPNVPNKELDDVAKVTPSLPTRGRGRGRGRGATPKRGFGRGRRGASQGRIGVADESLKPNLDTTEASSSFVGTDIVIKQEVLTEDEKSEGSSVGGPLTLQIHDMFKKIINKEAEDNSSPKKSFAGEVKTPSAVEALTPIVRKRGRPRKSVQTPILVPEEMIMVQQEPTTPVYTTPVYTDGGEGDDGSSGTGRPKRTCRGRTKPIVVKKRKPRGGGAAGTGLPRGASTPLPTIEIKEEIITTPVVPDVPTEATTLESSTVPTATPSPPVDKAVATPTPPARGRGSFKRPTPDRNTLSEKELAELQKIEAKKEKLRLDRIAKYEAKKAKKLAKKLKDEERRKRIAREKAEKAEAAAPQVFEEETRMSAPDSSSRGHTPAPHRILTGDGVLEESQNSISTPGDTNKGNKKGRMEISITDMDCLVKDVRVDELAEYQWQGSELFMIQEQISLYLGVKSFKRKYPGLKRRPVEAEERTFLEDSGLVPKSMCDLGLTAVGSAEILDIMFQDFPEKYEEFRKHVRDKQAREASFKQKAAIGLQRKDGTKVEPREQALEAVAAWNANLNRERREERRCALDLQTFTVHYPKLDRDNMKKPTPKVGLYPVAVIPGQFCDHYKKYTPNELMYFPVNTVLYGPLRPNERQRDSDDGSGSESSSSSSSSSSSGESSSESESEGDEPSKCKMCNGTKKKNKDSMPEVLLTCVQCKSCYHPTCKEFTPEMIIHLTKYEWQCTACKKCSKCRDPNLKDRIMCCQLCDRGYHLSCIGLKKMPEGRWHCTVCAYCSSCGSRNPGGSDWQHEFKKGEKGVKIYQRTLCTPCFKLWRKGKYCQLCSKCHSMKPEEDASLIQCNSCDRWLHKDCYGSKYGLTNKLMSTSSIQCDYCVERITLGSHGINRSLIKV